MSSWEPTGQFLQRGGYDWVRVAYYGGECSTGADATTHGDHDRWMANHHTPLKNRNGSPFLTYGPGCDGEMPHDVDTDYRHIAYHLAWWLYDEFTSKGVAVDVFAHSMGGLLIRYALANSPCPAPDPEFVGPPACFWPDELDVESIVTLGTPHGGSQFACDAASSADASTMGSAVGYQERQFCGKSSTAQWMRVNAQNPQGSKGTAWSLVGSARDEVVTMQEATEMEAAYDFRYAGPTTSFETEYHTYSHGEYPTDDSPLWDMQGFEYAWVSGCDCYGETDQGPHTVNLGWRQMAGVQTPPREDLA